MNRVTEDGHVHILLLRPNDAHSSVRSWEVDEMSLRVYTQPSEFMAPVQPALERDEVGNNVTLGVGLRLIKDVNAYGSAPFLAAAWREDAPVLATVMTPPYPVQLCDLADGWQDAIPDITRALHERACVISGVFAGEAVARMFADIWCALNGCTHHVAKRARVHQLTAVTHPAYGPGFFRAANEHDLPLLTEWFRAFQAEAGPFSPNDEPAVRKRAQEALEENRAYFWEDGQPVSMALRLRATRHAECIGSVYTPPGFRKHGYASCCVARLSQHILDSGKRVSCLYTGLANPTSNKIYAALGYMPVRDLVMLAF